MLLKQFIITTVIFLLALVPRLYRLDNPVADWHSWRQADTAAVSRNFIKEGFTPFLPKFDSFFALNAYSDQNPKRYFLAEFPLYNMLTYPLYVLYGAQEYLARLVSAVVASFGAVFLYSLVRRFSSDRVAILAAVFYAILPFNIYYGRVIMPDPLHVTLSILALLLVSLWTDKKHESGIGNQESNKFWIELGLASIAGLVYAGALLTKPYGLVLGIPIGYLILRRWGWSTFTRPSVYLFGMVALLPLIVWRWHIGRYPEGQFGTDWLFNEGNIRFTGAYFRWLIFERMNRLILATGGFVLFILGIIRGRTSKEGWVYYLWLCAVLLFFVVIAKGNVTHDYYQLPLIPIACIFMAKGFEFLAMYGRGLKHRIINFNIGIILVLLMLAFGWYETRGFFNINHPEIVAAGKAADLLLPKEAKVIAPYQSDSAFLYQTNRYGWTVGGGLIEQFIQDGATHLVSVNYDEDTKLWMNRCQIVIQNEAFVIVDLRNCRSEEFEPDNMPGIDDVGL